MAHMRPATDPWCLWLRERLTALGITPKAFAVQLGLSRQAVYWMLNDGGSLPPDSRVNRLSVLLACSEDDVRKARGAAWAFRGGSFGIRPASHTPNNGACA